MARTRKDVWAIENDPNDKTLEHYARAVAAMKKRPITDPKSWRFQAAVHDYDRDFDPLAVPNEAMPSQSVIDKYWSQCQHASFFFLPWHRMYLHHFEQLIRSEIAAFDQQGAKDWALPYWNYSKSMASRLLPPSFRNPKLSDGSENPLYVAERSFAANSGDHFADQNDVDLRPALRAQDFANPPFGPPGFGGPATISHNGQNIGLLEWVPHGLMHGAVGGGGWMGAFNTAALDPIFWLHHANIDRLWEVWLKRDPSHKNPTNAFWRTGVAFPFFNADGAAIEMRCIEVIDAAAQPLDYSYDDVNDPLATEATVSNVTSPPMASNRTPEMIGATLAPFELTESVKHAVITTAAEKSALESAGKPKRMFLRIEHLTSDDQAPAYDVYLGVPKGADPTKHESLRVGRISTFGLRESSKMSGPHAGSGLSFALEVTNVVAELAKDPKWNPNELPISFVPAGESKKPPRVRVGRVSLYSE